MASEDSRGEKAMIDLSGDVYDWLEEMAAGTDDDADTVARRLLAAHRELSAGDAPVDPADASGEGRAVTEGELDTRLDTLDDTVRDLIEDVRKRVIQLKRETDAKAADDHDHGKLLTRLDEAEQRVVAAERRAQSAGERIDEVENSLSTGFENYEEILTYLTEETESAERRLDVLARAVIELRSEVEAVAAERARRDGVDELKRAANQQGIRTADCAACSASVDLGLLTRPNCPQCMERFVDVSPGKRFFNANTLETGDPPALTEAVGVSDELAEEIDDAFETESERAAPEWEPPGDVDA